ncbi:hypothetical protein Tco_1031836 [Tanacetum coccineum]|uniref:Uncharacterized protein n=1 Tax=Tanacetum coccineum TaxID=301880 RepID=A0ABQ5GAM9_9ASTR
MVENVCLTNMGRITGQRKLGQYGTMLRVKINQNKLTHPHPKRKFLDPTASEQMSGNVLVNTAKQSTSRAALNKHHFIRDSYEKKLIQVIKIHTDHNVADILIKAFDVSRFNFLVASIVKQIHAIVDGKAIVISESSMRNDLLFDDEDGITCLTNDEIFKDLALMGSKSTGWNEFSTNLASAVICLAKGQKFNFSKLIFDGMLRNLDLKKFLMYPRFLQLFLNNQLKDLPELFNDTYDTPSHTKKIFSNMARQSKGFSGKVTPLFDSMLVQNHAREGEGSAIPPEPQPTPSISQPTVSEPQKTPRQTETPPTVSHEPQTEAHIEQILPSPSTYHRKHIKTQKHRKDKKVTELPQTNVPLDHEVDEVVHKEGGDSVERAITTDPSLVAAQDSDNTIRTQTTAMPNVDIPQGMDIGGSPRRQETMGVLLLRLGLRECLKSLMNHLSQKVLDLEKEKDAQAMEILKLKKRVKKLERQRNLTPKKEDIQAEVSTDAPRTPPTTTTVFDDEDVTMAMAQTLIKMKEEKAKEKGVAIKDVEDSSRPIRSITILQPLLTIDFKDKGKGILQETKPVEKSKKKVQGDAQIERDAKIALRLQAELDKELRVEIERQEEAYKVVIADMFDEVQARIDDDYELAARMTQEEQEKYTIEERARLLAEFFERRKKQLAAERAEAIRNKPPTKTQQQKRIQDFTPMDSEKEAQMPGKRLKRVAGSYATQKSPKKSKVMKSAKDVTEEEAAEYEKKKEELMLSLKIISNDDSEVNYEPLSRKFPIVNWEYQLLGKMEEKDMYVYKLTRADGSSS